MPFWHINNKYVANTQKKKCPKLQPQPSQKKNQTHENIYSLNVCGKGRFVSHTAKLNGSIALQFSIFIQRNKEEILYVSFIFRGSRGPLKNAFFSCPSPI